MKRWRERLRESWFWFPLTVPLPPPPLPSTSQNYITIGSFGTNEELSPWWVDQYQTGIIPAKDWDELGCPPFPTSHFKPSGYQPTQPGQFGHNGRCLAPRIAALGAWCPTSQPEYSRWRQHAYGTGLLDFISPDKAVWSFYSQEGAMVKPLDEVVIKRADAKACALTPESQAAAATTGVSVESALVSSKLVNVTFELDVLKNKLNVSTLNATKGLSVDLSGGKAGIVRSGVDYVQAKAAAANFSLIALVDMWNNKTGG